MDHALLSALIIAAVLLLAALIVVWARRRTWLRVLAIPAAILGTSVSAAVLLESLGYAVPLINGVTAPTGEAPLLSAKMVVGDGIYVTLDLTSGPRLYWLPWDRKMADSLQAMLEDKQNADGSFMMTVPPFEFSWNQHAPSFRALPQPKVLPDKPPEPPEPPHFTA